MKITIIFPGREVEMGKANMPVMPLAPTLLAALTPAEHEVKLIDMFYGDEPDYDGECELVAITVRTPSRTCRRKSATGCWRKRQRDAFPKH